MDTIMSKCNNSTDTNIITIIITTNHHPDLDPALHRDPVHARSIVMMATITTNTAATITINLDPFNCAFLTSCKS
jgi:hypothetical protein